MACWVGMRPTATLGILFLNPGLVGYVGFQSALGDMLRLSEVFIAFRFDSFDVEMSKIPQKTYDIKIQLLGIDFFGK